MEAVARRGDSLAAPRSLARLLATRFLRVSLRVLGPSLFLRQLAALAVLIAMRRGLWFGRRLFRYYTRSLRCFLSAKARQEADLRGRRRKCRDYASFKVLGEQIDSLQGLDRWKLDDNSPHFDAQRIRQRTDAYVEMMEAWDVEGCMFALRQELLRKHFGVCNPALFDVCCQGTKAVIERYTKVVCEVMTWVAFAHREGREEPGRQVSVQEKLAFFNETKHSFGRSALLLSGGAQLGMYHFGVIKALHLNGFLPRIIAGASAGSIVCGMICTNTDAELTEMWEPDFQWERHFDLHFFDGPDFGRFVRKGGEGLYCSQRLEGSLRRNIGEETFLEAFDRTGRICNITVSGVAGHTRYPLLLNYLTSPHVLVWSAALASAAVPGVFEARELLSKDRHGNIVPYFPGGLKWRDGSMQSDLPMTRITELFNVNYFVVSQVNPQARLFSGGGYGTARGPVYRVGQFLRCEIKQYLLSMMELFMGTAGGRVSPWLRPVGLTAVGLVVQEYEGDVTIYNGRGLIELPSILKNGDQAMLEKYTQAAEWETWWAIPRIENACAIEYVMDEIIKELRGEVIQRRTGDGTVRGLARNSSRALLKRVMSQDMGVKRLPSFHQQFLQMSQSPDEQGRLEAALTRASGQSESADGVAVRVRQSKSAASMAPSGSAGTLGGLSAMGSEEALSHMQDVRGVLLDSGRGAERKDLQMAKSLSSKKSLPKLASSASLELLCGHMDEFPQ